MSPLDFNHLLPQYAEVIVKIGLNLQAGQRLLLNAPLSAAPLVRQVAASAYQSGCRYVDVLWRDEEVNLIRHQHAPRDSFDEFPAYYAEGAFKHVQSGGALLSITGDNPDLLRDQDPENVALAEKTRLKYYRPMYELMDHNIFNWCIAAWPSPSWAEKVFPQAAPDERREKLWQALLHVCRADLPDPVAAWQQHQASLAARCAYLTGKQYHALHFQAPDTDLTIGLAERHIWVGGGSKTQSGISFIPNLPTEEVFTLPHRQRIQGVVRASMPLSRAGALIDDFSLTFENGRVVKAHARQGEAVLRRLMESDEGMGSLGEVALVPFSSPVSQTGILFYNTLLDENAASHIALGNGVKYCTENGENLSAEEIAARGGNTSLNHVDFMIGSAEMDVDGVYANGQREPLMRHGEWAFDTI